jgi:glycerophosphoryl diester phosphodiesterase
LHAIENAVGLGCHAIELDIHMTSDGYLVACHDPTLERTTNASGAIADHTLAQLTQLDNAYWFVPGEDVQSDRDSSEYVLRGMAPADHGYGIATLDEIIDVTHGILLNLDIKKTAPEVPPYEVALADLLRNRGRTDDVIVASFLDSATDTFKDYAPEIATSAGTNAVAEFFRAVRAGEAPAETVKRHVALQVPVAFQDVVIVDERFVEEAHDAGLAVHVWTINERTEMEELLDLGVDGIISDTPTVLVDVLKERGLNWADAHRPATDGSGGLV